MDLYVDPLTPTSRSVMAFCRHAGIAVSLRQLSLMKGEQNQPAFAALNPNQMVPVLVDDDFVLTESSAILRYLARRQRSPLYPEDLKRAARVDELLAWFDANFFPAFGHDYVYPQFLPDRKRGTAEATRSAIEWGRERSVRWLRVLDRHLLGHQGRFLLGEQLSIADFQGAAIASLGEIVGCRFDGFPNIQRWYATVGELDSWREVSSAYRQFARSLEGRSFVPLAAAQAEPA